MKTKRKVSKKVKHKVNKKAKHKVSKKIKKQKKKLLEKSTKYEGKHVIVDTNDDYNAIIHFLQHDVIIRFDKDFEWYDVCKDLIMGLTEVWDYKNTTKKGQ